MLELVTMGPLPVHGCRYIRTFNTWRTGIDIKYKIPGIDGIWDYLYDYLAGLYLDLYLDLIDVLCVYLNLYCFYCGVGVGFSSTWDLSGGNHFGIA